jgi:hypothetical protein
MDASSGTPCFRTDGRKRFAEIARSVFELAGGVPLAMLFGAAIGFALSVIGAPIWLCCGLGFVVAFLLVRSMSREAISRLRFRVMFHPDHVELGGGPARLNAPYEEVEMFGYTREARVDCFGLLWQDHNAVVYLPADSLVACLQMLRDRCLNAIYVDRGGREHLPPNPSRPDFTIKTLSRHYRRVGRASLRACAASVILAVYSGVGVIGCVIEKFPLEHIHFVALFVASVTAVIASWLAYRRYSGRARLIAGKLATLIDEGAPAP